LVSQSHPKPLDPSEKDAMLKPLIDAGWKLSDEEDAIAKTYQFKSFNEAFGFIKAEELNHHPDWCNFFHKVRTEEVKEIIQNEKINK